MKNNILVEVSNRHVHLSRKDIDALFGEGHQLNIFRELSQPGHFAAEEKVTLINKDKKIENVRVLGPERKETQVELSKTDADLLGIDAPSRDSGYLENTPGLVLEGSKGTIELEKGAIIARKHIHVSEKEAKQLGLEENQIVSIKLGESMLNDVVVRIHSEHKMAVHIDRDEAKEASVDRKAFGEIIKH